MTPLEALTFCSVEAACSEVAPFGRKTGEIAKAKSRQGESSGKRLRRSSSVPWFGESIYGGVTSGGVSPWKLLVGLSRGRSQGRFLGVSGAKAGQGRESFSGLFTSSMFDGKQGRVVNSGKKPHSAA